MPVGGHYRFISEEQKRLVITMLDRGQTPANIENATGISVRTVQRVRRLWLSTGRVAKHPLEKGRGRILTSLEVSVSDYSLNSGFTLQVLKAIILLFLQFLESLVEQRPDIYLKELQHALFVVYDVEVSNNTVNRALRNRGFTRKKV